MQSFAPLQFRGRLIYESSCAYLGAIYQFLDSCWRPSSTIIIGMELFELAESLSITRFLSLPTLHWFHLLLALGLALINMEGFG